VYERTEDGVHADEIGRRGRVEFDQGGDCWQREWLITLATGQGGAAAGERDSLKLRTGERVGDAGGIQCRRLQWEGLKKKNICAWGCFWTVKKAARWSSA